MGTCRGRWEQVDGNRCKKRAMGTCRRRWMEINDDRYKQREGSGRKLRAVDRRSCARWVQVMCGEKGAVKRGSKQFVEVGNEGKVLVVG